MVVRLFLDVDGWLMGLAATERARATAPYRYVGYKDKVVLVLPYHNGKCPVG